MIVRPRRGDAVLFYNQHPDGRKDLVRPGAVVCTSSLCPGDACSVVTLPDQPVWNVALAVAPLSHVPMSCQVRCFLLLLLHFSHERTTSLVTMVILATHILFKNTALTWCSVKLVLLKFWTRLSSFRCTRAYPSSPGTHVAVIYSTPFCRQRLDAFSLLYPVIKRRLMES